MALTRPRLGQINTVVATIGDPLTLLNQSSTVSNIDIGFVMNRDGGTTSNVAVFWDESANSFALAYTTSSGLTNGNIAISGYANLQANNITGTITTANQPNITTVGTLGNLVVAGNIETPKVFASNVTLTNVLISGSASISYNAAAQSIDFIIN